MKCKPMVAGRGGWCEWITPTMTGYLMQCCQCDLIHEVQFRVLQQTAPADVNGEWTARPIKNGRVEMRVRRLRKNRSKP